MTSAEPEPEPATQMLFSTETANAPRRAPSKTLMNSPEREREREKQRERMWKVTIMEGRNLQDAGMKSAGCAGAVFTWGCGE